MNILITGSNGYIGGRLVKHLSCFEVNKLFLSSEKSINFDSKRIKLRQINWNNTNDIFNSCRNIDIVIHLAGMNSQYCQKYPDDCKEFNLQNTLRLFKSAIRFNVKKFLFLSSIHVYGDVLCSDISEACLKRPVGPYAYLKSLAEDELLKLNEKGKLQLYLLRLSNVFGPPANDLSECWSLVFNDMTYQAIKKGKILVKSNGEQMRDFMTMTDFCRSIEHIITNFDNEIKYNIFNIGGNKTLKISEVANFIQERSQNYINKVEISINGLPSKTNKKKFSYNTSRFSSTGFKLNQNFNKELDDLFEFVINKL